MCQSKHYCRNQIVNSSLEFHSKCGKCVESDTLTFQTVYNKVLVRLDYKQDTRGLLEIVEVRFIESFFS